MNRFRWTVAALLAAAVAAGYLYYSGPGRQERPVSVDDRTSVAPVRQSQQIDLYFADTSESRLALERREVTGATMPEMVASVVEEIIAGPVDDRRSPTLPADAGIRNTFFRDGVAYVDFSSAVRDDHPGGAWTEVLSVYSVVNSLTENFAEVESVQILIEGREADTLAGHVDIRKPLRGRVQLLSGDWE